MHNIKPDTIRNQAYTGWYGMELVAILSWDDLKDDSE